MLGVGGTAFLDGQQAGDRLVAASDDELLSVLHRREESRRVLLEFFDCCRAHGNESGLLPVTNQAGQWEQIESLFLLTCLSGR